jgi:hypothetical protein
MDTSVGASEPPTPASPDSGETRGRRRDRDEDGDTGDGEGDGQGSSRKRRRSRKGLDKKFECPHEGCKKSYSRAEHLYRHQLNRELLLVGKLSIHMSQTAPLESRMLMPCRQPQANLPLRLPRLPSVFRPARPMRTSQRETYGTRIAIAAQGYIQHAQPEPDSDRSIRRQECASSKDTRHEEPGAACDAVSIRSRQQWPWQSHVATKFPVTRLDCDAQQARLTTKDRKRRYVSQRVRG